MDGNMELRAAAADWSLAGDKQLLHLITALHQKIIVKSEETSNKLLQMTSALDSASISLQNVNNRFQSLSNSQFIESRVYEDDIDAPHSTGAQIPTAEAEPASRDPTSLLQHSLARLEYYHEPVRILPDSDGDTDSGSDSEDRLESVVLRARELYAARPLPHIIGSAQWKAKWHAGLVAEESGSESEGSVPRATPQPSEDFSSEDEGSDDAGAVSPHKQESFSSEELPEPRETHQPLSQSELAAELARRLGGVGAPRDTDQDEAEPAAPRARAAPPPFTAADTLFRPQQLPHDRLTGAVFCDEPPALDTCHDDDSEQTEDDIFADLDDAPIFHHGTKKPTGAVSLFSDEIGAAIRNHNTERSKGSPPVRNKITIPTPNKNTIPTQNKNVREERQLPREEEIDAFADLFAAADVPISKPQKDIHKDSLFDDIDDLFSTDIVSKVPIKETSKNAKGLFDDDDDLFSDVQVDKSKVSKDTLAKIGDHHDLFAEGRAVNENIKVTGRSENITSVQKDSQVRVGLFDDYDDDDLFAEGHAVKQEVKVAGKSEDIKSVQKDSQVRAGIFDDDDDDDLFSERHAVKQTVRVTRRSEERKSIQNDSQLRAGLIDDDDLFAEGHAVKQSGRSKEIKIVQQDSQLRAGIFDDHDDDLFAEGHAVKQTVGATGSSEDINSVQKDSQLRAGLIDDDGLFAEEHAVKQSGRSEDIKIVQKDSQVMAGIFDDDHADDLFSEGHAVKQTVDTTGSSEDVKSVQKDSQVSAVLFADDYDDIILGGDKAKETMNDVKISKVVDTNETFTKTDNKVEGDIFDHNKDMFKSEHSTQKLSNEILKISNGVDPLLEGNESNYDVMINTPKEKPQSIISQNTNGSETISDNKKLIRDNLGTLEIKKQTNPLLFDDDDMDTLFSVNVNTQKAKADDIKKTVLGEKQSNQSNDSVLPNENISENSSNKRNDKRNEFTKEIKDDLNETFKENKTDLQKTDEITKHESNKLTVKEGVATKELGSEILSEPNVSGCEEYIPGKISEVTAKDLENGIFCETPPSLPQETVDTFHDIFIDQPPEFQRTTESKKSKNINALFDDDSDDEALFFKKNDVPEEKIEVLPDIQHEKPVFGLFYDEPPDLDFEFEQKNERSEVTSVRDRIHVTSEQSQSQHNVSYDVKRIPTLDNDKSKRHAVYEDDVVDNVTTIETKTLTSQLLAKDPVIQSNEEPKKVGKLKHSNININVNTLLPGASPKKMSSKNIETTPPNDNVEEIDATIPKTVVFQEESDSLLCNKLSKERPKIQVKRRPPSRRARKEAARRSAIEAEDYDSTEGTQSVEKSISRQVKISTLGKVYATPLSDDENLFGQAPVKTDILQQNNDAVNKDSFQTLKENDGWDVKNRPHDQTDVAADDLFGSLPINKNEINDDDIFKKSQKSTEKHRNPVPGSNEGTKKVTLFDDDSDDDDLFGAKKRNDPIGPQQKPAKLKDNIPPSRVVAAKSLFGNDSDEDLFGTEIESASGPSLAKSKEETKIAAKSSKDPASTELVFDDPLSAFGPR